MTYQRPYQPTPPPSPTPPPPKRSAGQWILALVVVGAIGAVVIIGATAGSETSGAPAAPAETQLKQAHDSCSAGVLGDVDHTMTLDMGGEDSDSGILSFDQVACVLEQLDIPASVASRMDATRALDGMQDAEWDGFTASWTYHPDDGLDIILTEN